MKRRILRSPESSFSTGQRFNVLLATGFGLGRIPFAPGTFGTLPGVALVAVLWPFMTSVTLQIILAAVLVILAIPICGTAESAFRNKDDQRIVADEYLIFPIGLIGLPISWATWWILLMAFVTARVCDIVKPPPARAAQHLRGGLGIVADDVIAALYSLAINHGLYRTARHYLEGTIGF